MSKTYGFSLSGKNNITHLSLKGNYLNTSNNLPIEVQNIKETIISLIVIPYMSQQWNKLKEKGIEPKLDDLTYGLTNFEKYSEYDMNIIRPIWFEYNGGYNKVYEKFLNDILNKEFNITESRYELNMNVLVTHVEDYGVMDPYPLLEVEILNGYVNGFILDDEGNSIERRMTIDDQFAELEYDTGDFEDYLINLIGDHLNDLFEEKYGIIIRYITLI